MSTQVNNTKTLFKHLCSQMERLSKNEVTVEEAKAQANLVKQANNLIRYELDRASFVSKNGDSFLRNIEDS
jgi:hypothetical protein